MSTPAAAKSVEFDDYGKDDGILSTLLWYGLFVGAIFQVICICATLFLPPSDAEPESSVNEETKQGGETTVRRPHKLRKQEKKKRR